MSKNTVSGGRRRRRRRARLSGNALRESSVQRCQTLPRSSMRKKLINTNWIRQGHPWRAVVVGKPDWTELEREALTAGRGCTGSRGGGVSWKRFGLMGTLSHHSGIRRGDPVRADWCR